MIGLVAWAGILKSRPLTSTGWRRGEPCLRTPIAGSRLQPVTNLCYAWSQAIDHRNLSLQPSFKKVPKYANQVTIPKAFKLNGYATSTLGKIYHGALPKGEFDKAGTRAKLPNRFPPQKLVSTLKITSWWIGDLAAEDSDQLDYKLRTGQ